jgi:hypothetical protein
MIAQARVLGVEVLDHRWLGRQWVKQEAAVFERKYALRGGRGVHIAGWKASQARITGSTGPLRAPRPWWPGFMAAT